MRYIHGLFRVLKRANHARIDSAVAKYSSENNPTLVTCSSQGDTLDLSETPEKQTLKAKFKHTITHRASRIPRWTGIKRAFVEEKDVCLSQKPPFSTLHKENIPVRDGKSLFARVKCALRKVSRIPRSKRVQPKLSLSSASRADAFTNPCHSEGLGVFITTRVEADFFNEEDLMAIINPVVEVPQTVSLPYVPTLPRDEPFPFSRRFNYRPRFRRAVPVDASVEALFSIHVAGVATGNVVVEDVCVDDLAHTAALSTDESLQNVCPAEIVAEPLVVRQQDVLPKAAEEPPMIACPILFKRNSPKFIFAASASSSSLSTSDESGVEPVSSATCSPVSPIPTLDQSKKAEVSVDDSHALDSDSDQPFNHFRRVNTTKKNYPCLESWYNKIISELKHANEVGRSSVTSSGLGIKGTLNQDDVDTAADRDTLEASQDSICSSDLELSSVPARFLCDPKSLSADSAPRVSSVVSGVRQAGLKPAVEDLEASHLLSFLEKAVGVSSATSTCSSEGEESPSVRAARNSRACLGAQGKHSRGVAPPLPPPFKDSPFFEEMRRRARNAAVYRDTSAHFQGFSGASPTPHRARRGAGYRCLSPSPLMDSVTDLPGSLPSSDTMHIPRPRGRTVLAAEPPTREPSPHSYQHPALAVANSFQARPSAHHAFQPEFTTTPSSTSPVSRFYDIHISPTIFPSVSGTPRPSMIPRHVNLQRREWASAARLASFTLAPSLRLPSKADSRPSMIPRHPSLR